MAYKALIKRQDWDFVVFRYAFKAVRIDDTKRKHGAKAVKEPYPMTKDDVLRVLRYAQLKGYESTSELSDAEIDSILHYKKQSDEKHESL